MTEKLFNGECDNMAKCYMGFLNMHCRSAGNADGNIGMITDLAACLTTKGNRADAASPRSFHRGNDI